MTILNVSIVNAGVSMGIAHGPGRQPYGGIVLPVKGYELGFVPGDPLGDVTNVYLIAAEPVAATVAAACIVKNLMSDLEINGDLSGFALGVGPGLIPVVAGSPVSVLRADNTCSAPGATPVL